MRASRHPRGEEQALLPEVPHRGARRPGSSEGLEQQAHAVLDLLVRVQHHARPGKMDQADRQGAAQLAATCLVEDTAAREEL